jgi:peptide/nickel transport system permease protein
MFLSALTVIGMFLSDLALAVLDPRIRLAGGTTK